VGLSMGKLGCGLAVGDEGASCGETEVMLGIEPNGSERLVATLSCVWDDPEISDANIKYETPPIASTTSAVAVISLALRPKPLFMRSSRVSRRGQRCCLNAKGGEISSD
jgi:hypothetical protein